MRDFNAQSRAAYNRKADDYENTTDGKFTRKFKTLLLEQVEINSNDAVLDVACGNGLLLKMLAEKQVIKGFGIDIAENMIKNAKLNCPEMVFHVSGCEKIPLENASVDIITVSAAYHHFPDVASFAKEAARVLKPQGQIYIAEVWLPFIFRVLFNPFLPFMGSGDVKIYSPQEIIKTFESQKFTTVKTLRKGKVQIIQMQKQ